MYQTASFNANSRIISMLAFGTQQLLKSLGVRN